jgi:NADPH2:quinone reductase
MGVDVLTHQIGDRVIGCAALPFGGFSEYALMAASGGFAPPPDFNHAEAAAFHLGYQTAWIGLTRRADIQPGETLLVHAAAGGVGSAAVQLGKLLGALVIGVVGGEGKCDIARSLGADVVIDRKSEDFVEVVHDITNGRGADVIFDPVGGETYRRSTKCIAFEGRIIVVGFAGGEISAAPLNHALVRNYTIVGLHWGLYLTRKVEVVEECQVQLTRLANEGLIRPLISESSSIEELPELLQRLADGVTIGRVSMACDLQFESRR